MSAMTMTMTANHGVRAARPRTSSVRLTRRGRFAALLVVFAAATATFSLGGAHSSTAPLRVERSSHLLVRPGDTLWQIAERVAPGADPRETIATIMSTNHLTGESVVPGQVLLVP